MFALVLCLSVFAASNGHIVTINKELNQSWSQAKFPAIVDGSELPSQIKAITLHFPPSAPKTMFPEDLNIIANFPDLTDLFIDNYSLSTIPILANLPKLKTISLMRNELYTISNSTFFTSTVEVLLLSGNKIENISDSAFGMKAREVYLTCNRITYMSRDWFTHPESLRLLHLGGNKIKIVPENMFDRFTNLRRLELRNNQITTLAHSSLSGPTNLTWLHLGHNNITEIKPTVFGDADTKTHILYMDIQYNKMSFLHEDLLKKLQVENLRVWGNPWQCPCRNMIRKWLKNNRVDGGIYHEEEDTPCIYVASLGTACVQKYSDEIIEEFKKVFKPFRINLC